MTLAWHRRLVFVGLVLLAVVLRIADANPAVAQNQLIAAWRVQDAPPMDGSAPDWQSILPVFLPTTSQQVAPPMGGGSIERVAVRALNDDERIFVMLEWSDATADWASDGYQEFTDAAAVQLPAEAGSEVPAICMGQADQGVNIWQWRADQQMEPPVLPDSGYVDFYPEAGDLYLTAREAGNPLSQADDRSAVTNLVAGGFGTLEVTSRGELLGNAVHRDGRWMVVFSRPLGEPGEMQPTIDGTGPIDVAFAIWNGSERERNGIKSVSPFTQIQVAAVDPPRRSVSATDEWPAYTPANMMHTVSWAVLGLLVAAFVGFWVYMLRGSRMVEDERTG